MDKKYTIPGIALKEDDFVPFEGDEISTSAHLERRAR
jgi:hypothetical protein